MKRYTVSVIIILLISTAVSTGCVIYFRKNFDIASKKSILSQFQPNEGKIESFQGNLRDEFRKIVFLPTIGDMGIVSEKISDEIPKITKSFSNSNIEQSKNASQEKKTVSAVTFSFVLIGDTQNFNIENENGYFQQAVSSLRKTNPNLIISLGDLVQQCSDEKECVRDFSYWNEILGDLTKKTYAVQGNHDRTGGKKSDKTWQTSFNFPKNGPDDYSEIAYYFDYKNSRFVILASDNPEQHLINGVERAWLEKTLSNSKAENNFVFFHEPAFPTYEVTGGSLDKKPGERDALWEILDRHNVTAVFCGHEHMISRRKIDSSVFPSAKNSIYQFIFGNTDSFEQNLPAPGVVEYADQGQGRFGLVKVRGKEITVEAHGPNGDLLDTFTYQK
jgi:hypothetical protein